MAREAMEKPLRFTAAKPGGQALNLRPSDHSRRRYFISTDRVGYDEDVQFSIGGEDIVRVQEEVDLGVTINDRGKHDSQCRKSAKKANGILGMMRRTARDRSRRTLIPLYKSVSLVRPQLEYCSSVWRPYFIRKM